MKLNLLAVDLGLYGDFVRRTDRLGGISSATATSVGRTLWDYAETADLVFPTTGVLIRTTAGNANDHHSGTGAQAITVYGLDENFVPLEETIETAGIVAGTQSVNTFRRIYGAYVSRAGIIESNVGLVKIEDPVSGDVLCAITAGMGASRTGAYTVPAGFVATMTETELHLTRAATAGSVAEVHVFSKTSDANSAWILQGSITTSDGGQSVSTYEGRKYPPKTDLKFEIGSLSKNDVDLGAHIHLTLVKESMLPALHS